MGSGVKNYRVEPLRGRANVVGPVTSVGFFTDLVKTSVRGSFSTEAGLVSSRDVSSKLRNTPPLNNTPPTYRPTGTKLSPVNGVLRRPISTYEKSKEGGALPSNKQHAYVNLQRKFENIPSTYSVRAHRISNPTGPGLMPLSL